MSARERPFKPRSQRDAQDEPQRGAAKPLPAVTRMFEMMDEEGQQTPDHLLAMQAAMSPDAG